MRMLAIGDGTPKGSFALLEKLGIKAMGHGRRIKAFMISSMTLLTKKSFTNERDLHQHWLSFCKTDCMNQKLKPPKNLCAAALGCGGHAESWQQGRCNRAEDMVRMCNVDIRWQ